MDHNEVEAKTIDGDPFRVVSPLPGGWAQVDQDGRLVLPPAVAARYGLLPGESVRFNQQQDSLLLHRAATHLAKVYIEPTSRCNLACRTCMRNVWAEPRQDMTVETFACILDGLRELPVPPIVTFSGFGEPLMHPKIAWMIAQVKQLAQSVELISNAMLFTPAVADDLVHAGLDVLWVSMDGITPEQYSGVRVGGQLTGVLENIKTLHIARRAAGKSRPEVGISFVAMRRNIADLPRLLNLSRELGIARFMISNVLAYTEEMCKETLYNLVARLTEATPSKWSPRIDLPPMDLNETTQAALNQALRSHPLARTAGQSPLDAAGSCPFISKGVVGIAWNGDVSPCLPLMHDHTSYLEPRRMRFSRRYVIGNVNESRLLALWRDPEHIDFRRRVQAFDFPPCVICGGCDLAEATEEDCYGNTFPTCGGCLWAQGVIQCP